MEWTPEINCAYGVTFTIAAAGATVLVALQLKDYAGNALTAKNAVTVYCSSDTKGDTLVALTTLVDATHGFSNILLATKIFHLVTEDTGIVDVTLDGTGPMTVYMNVILPNGKIVTSGAIVFNA